MPWNPFHYEDPALESLISHIQRSQGAAQLDASRALNAYLVKRAWIAPLDVSMRTYATIRRIWVAPFASASRRARSTRKPRCSSPRRRRS